MAALTQSKKVDRVGTQAVSDKLSFPVAATTHIYNGALVFLNAGYATPATVATGRLAVGVAQAEVDNDPGAAGDLEIEVRPGIFAFENNGANAVAQANVGSLCYAEDDQTVSTNATGRSAAGRVIRIEGTKIWVQVGLGLSLGDK